MSPVIRTATMKTWIIFFFTCAVAAAVKADMGRIPDQFRPGAVELPVNFERNAGQADSTVQFLARGSSGSLFLTRDEAWLVSSGIGQTPEANALGLRFVGANSSPAPEGLDALSGKANYFFGAQSSRWLTNVPTFGRVRYREMYPGVDVVFYGSPQSLEYDLIVQPGADPNAILLHFDGADKITLDGNGDLLVASGKNLIRQHKPIVYQEKSGQRQELSGVYRLHSAMQVGIAVAEYDKSRPLVIDPVIGYCATLGGSGASSGLAVAIDTNQNVYITGNTTANNFPVASAYQSSFAGSEDAFVAKLDATGRLVYSTYLGGGILNNINQGSSGQGIAVDIYGDAFITGWTQVTNFPVKNALQPTNAGTCDAFVTELNPAGNGLVFSTYLGGKGLDAANGIALDTNANILVTGYTESTNFPTANAAQPVYGGNGDAFVAKLSNDGSALIYSTFLGGSNSENNAGSGLIGFPTAILPHLGGAIAVDFSGNACVTGWTYSTNFPTLNAFQSTNCSGLPNYDPVAFLTEIGPGGNIAYSTYFGGQAVTYGSVYGRAIGVDLNNGNVYLAGSSSAPNLPATNAFSPYIGAGGASVGDGFVAAFDSTGTNLVYCTYLGGSGDDQINGLDVRLADGAVVVTGSTSSSDFPLLNAVQTNGQQGFFKSANGAVNWSASSSPLSGSASVYAVQVDPFNPATIYAITRNGFFKSTDGGATWNFSGTGFGYFSAPYNGSANNDLAADPQHQGVIYAGCFAGVYKTTNGAANWYSAGTGLPAYPGIQALAVDPQNPATIYAGTYSYGVYKSMDGGNSWNVITNGLNNFNVTALAVDPLNSSNVFVGVQNYNNTCLFKSTNGGANWSAVSGMPADAFGEHTIVAFGINNSTIYAVVGDLIDDANLDVSTNGGTAWSSQFLAQGFKFTALALGPPSSTAPALSIARAGNGDVISWPATFTNFVLQFSPSLNPANWQPVGNSGVTVTNSASGTQGFYRLIGTNNSSSSLPTLYLGTDAASGQGVLKSVDGGASWNPVGFAGDTISAVAVNPANAAQVYAGLNGKNTGFISTLDSTGQLYFSTFLGGSGNDSGNAIAFWDETTVMGVGTTTSSDFPTNAVASSVQPIKTKSQDARPADEKESAGPAAAGNASAANVQDATSCGGTETIKDPIIFKGASQFTIIHNDDDSRFTHSVSGLPAGMDWDIVIEPGKTDYIALYGTPASGTYTVTLTEIEVNRFGVSTGCVWTYIYTVIVR